MESFFRTAAARRPRPATVVHTSPNYDWRWSPGSSAPTAAADGDAPLASSPR